MSIDHESLKQSWDRGYTTPMFAWRTSWQRLRAWLRPYPDDAEIQAAMLERVIAYHAKAISDSPTLMRLQLKRYTRMRVAIDAENWLRWHNSKFIRGAK